MKKAVENYKITDPNLVKIIKSGGVGVLPTDTLYGLVGSALSKEAVLKIYRLKNRNPKKKLIILIGAISDLKLFKIRLNKKFDEIIKEFWPGKVTIVLLAESKKFSYLLKQTKTLAFRLPKDKNLVQLIKKTGPLVAPSANPESKKPAETIKEAKKYFKSSIDFYVDGGRKKSLPSTIVRLRKNHLWIRRKGAVKIK